MRLTMFWVKAGDVFSKQPEVPVRRSAKGLSSCWTALQRCTQSQLDTEKLYRSRNHSEKVEADTIENMLKRHRKSTPLKTKDGLRDAARFKSAAAATMLENCAKMPINFGTRLRAAAGTGRARGAAPRCSCSQGGERRTYRTCFT